MHRIFQMKRGAVQRVVTGNTNFCSEAQGRSPSDFSLCYSRNDCEKLVSHGSGREYGLAVDSWPLGTHAGALHIKYMARPA